MRDSLPIAISPCPNDTFLFFPWILGYVGTELPIEPHFFDIEQLNVAALKQTFPLTKLSFPTFSKIRDHYDLLPIGTALGRKQGPKVISKRPYLLEELENARVAIPGRETTAHLLSQLFLPPTIKKHFCLYHEILDLVNQDQVDSGIIIHESRFLFAEKGLYQIADLGELFYQKNHSPVPLGGLVLQKKYDFLKEKVCSILQDSLAFAKAYPEKGKAFILEKSQEKSWPIVEQHIALYVSPETAALSKQGQAAIELLHSLALSISHTT